MKLKDRDLAIIAIIAIAMFGGGTGVLTKIAERDISPNLFTFLRFSVASLVLLPIVLKQRIKFDRDLLKLVAVSLFACGNVIFFSNGVKFTTANIAAVMYVLTPAIVAALSYFLLKEKISGRKILGLILGIFGGTTVILLPVIEKGIPFSGNLMGNLLVGIAVLSFSLYSVFSQNLQKKFSPSQITAVFCITAAITSFVLIAGQISQVTVEFQRLTSPSIISILYVALFSTTTFYFLYQFAIKHSSPLLASTNLYLQPLSTFVWAYLILGENLTPGLLVGGVAAVLGTIIVTTADRSKKLTTKTTI